MKLIPKKCRLFIVSVFLMLIAAGCSSTSEMQLDNSSWINTDTIKAGRFDTGRMWTFEYPPLDYFEEAYSFRPDENWLNDVRMSALRFATYCSASFVSEDGLIMTNNHCARSSAQQVSEEGEDLLENGFWAESMEDERVVPGLFVDQLVLIEDVTDEIQNAMDKAETPEERVEIEDAKMEEIEKRYADETGYITSVTPLYYGGRYSLYGYKRYNDVRLVFTPEHQIGHFGGDPDNFTYPRYNIDAAFFRVYDENGEPLKADHYFKWSDHGAIPGEAVFVVGNPGSTNRLETMAQLKYKRDIQYPRTLDVLNSLIDVYKKQMEENPEMREQLRVRLLSFQNSQKAYSGMLKGLRDPILMARKKDFEESFKKSVHSDPELNDKYGDLWEKIAEGRKELSEYTNELYLFSINRFRSPEYLVIANDLVELAEQLNKPEAERDDAFKGENLETTIEEIYPPEIDGYYTRQILEMWIDDLYQYLGKDDELVMKITKGKPVSSAADYMLETSILTSKEKTMELIDKGPEAILNSDDPFIYTIVQTKDKVEELSKKAQTIQTKEESYNQKLGKAAFEVYGTSIPPDATFTLRIADGIVKGFPYNGTIAPPITTFYGMYDRYYSFGKEYPWDLPEKWVTPPSEFDLETPYNFVSTNDIVGGNSGSPVINKNAEIVGVAFDGNIQSLPGSFIFRTEQNRTVSVHSAGIIEALKDMYKAERLVEELQSGKIVE